MINLSTPNDQLISEIASDYEKARYWAEKLIKKSEYKPMLRRMFTDHRLTGARQFSDVLLYQSVKGNKWCMYWTTDLSSGKLGITPRGFVYYETEGSIGAYLPMSDEQGGIKKCVILPSHFFVRLQERLGISGVTKETIQRLTEPLEGIVLDYKGSSEKRDFEIEVSVSGSVWRGVFRNGDVRIVEVKTFLKECSLSRKQQCKAQDLAKAQQGAVYHSRKSVKECMDKGEAHVVFEELFANEDNFNISGSLEYHYALFYTLTAIAANHYKIEFSKEKFRSMCKFVDKKYPASGFLSLLWEVSYGNLSKEDEWMHHLGLSYMAIKNFGYREDVRSYAKDFELFVSQSRLVYDSMIARFLPFEKRNLKRFGE